MNNKLYAKLAFINLKKNHKTYIPYLLTCIGTIAMFYIMSSLTNSNGIQEMMGGNELLIILRLGTIVIGIFSTIFLFYTNSFLMKRRKKEVGLYNILGMEKKHIAKMLCFEVLYTAVSSLVIGLTTGIIISKLMYWLLFKLLNFPIPITFTISINSIIVTILLFLAIFIVSLLSDFGKITLANPIELLRGGNVGEKEPKTKWLMTLIGFMALGGGYYIALATESPLEALLLFFVAVILVIIGTYALFTAGSIAVLKFLKKNKKFYYKTKHFTSVSGMLYRMKQNAVGLSNICILSTSVLVMLSTTVSLYIGQEDVLRTRYPRECMIRIYQTEEQKELQVAQLAEEELAKEGLIQTNVENYHYISTSIFRKNNGVFRFLTEETTEDLLDGEMYTIQFIPLEDYNKMYEKNEVLKEDEVIVIANNGKMPIDPFQLEDMTFTVKQQLNLEEFIDEYMMVNSCTIILPDINRISKVMKEISEESQGNISYTYQFDIEGDKQKIKEVENNLSEKIKEINENVKQGRIYLESRETSRENFFILYGGLFFLGIFLGSLFLMATVLIIYYKQISEGYEDKERFDIMQKVGMSRKEIKKSIQSQVRMVFFLPLLMSVIHIAFAFPVITKILYVLNLSNVALFFGCTVGTILAFALIYILVFAITAREYYRIVK